MRTFSCYFRYYYGDVLRNNELTVCWAGANTPNLFGKDIYIRKYTEKKTDKYQDLLIDIINEITPCKKKTLGELLSKEEYIQFRMLSCFNKSLVLLSFIRNLWHEPIAGYTDKFFKALEKSGEKYKDPLERLTWANKEACTDGSMYSPGHSNVHPKEKLLIRKKEDLLKTTYMSSTTEFLCGR